MDTCSIIRQGEIIECPGCQISIAKLKKPFYFGLFVTPDSFEWLAHEYTYGDETCCEKCGEYWASGGYLYIRGKGWQPRQYQMNS